jgi:hypothetical protein
MTWIGRLDFSPLARVRNSEYAIDVLMYIWPFLHFPRSAVRRKIEKPIAIRFRVSNLVPALGRVSSSPRVTHF